MSYKPARAAGQQHPEATNCIGAVWVPLDDLPHTPLMPCFCKTTSSFRRNPSTRSHTMHHGAEPHFDSRLTTALLCPACAAGQQHSEATKCIGAVWVPLDDLPHTPLMPFIRSVLRKQRMQDCIQAIREGPEQEVTLDLSSRQAHRLAMQDREARARKEEADWVSSVQCDSQCRDGIEVARDGMEVAKDGTEVAKKDMNAAMQRQAARVLMAEEDGWVAGGSSGEGRLWKAPWMRVVKAPAETSIPTRDLAYQGAGMVAGLLVGTAGPLALQPTRCGLKYSFLRVWYDKYDEWCSELTRFVVATHQSAVLPADTCRPVRHLVLHLLCKVCTSTCTGMCSPQQPHAFGTSLQLHTVPLC